VASNSSILTSPEKIEPARWAKCPPSVAHLFLDRVTATPDAEAYRYPVETSPGPMDERLPSPTPGWAGVTWSQVAQRVRRLAAGLIELGVDPQERVTLAASTSYEWVIADLAVMCAAAATTTVYPSSTAADVAFIVGNSGSRVVFAEDDAQIAKLDRAALPEVIRVITWRGTPDGDWVISLADLDRLGAARMEREPGVLAARIAGIRPEHLATLIYTSGTTGRPKGVRLPHSAWLSLVVGIEYMKLVDATDVQYLWLPLSHVFGKALLTASLQIGFSTVIDGRVDKIVDNLAVVQPTFMGAAPRIFEKAYAKVTETARAEGWVSARVFDWAIPIGRRISKTRQLGKRPSPALAAQAALADKLVFAKIRERFGGRLRFFISGSAALNQHVAEWFDAVGLPILEGYGLSETSAVTFVNRPWDNRLGTVGPPLPGVEVRLAPDGEVLLRGGPVMHSYHDDPAATAAAVDPDGWFHTGDLGEFAGPGLRLTGRKNDMIKTSNGKFVSPGMIDTMFKGICQYVAQLVVGEEGRPYITALVGLDTEEITGWAAAHGMADWALADIARATVTRELIQGYLNELNQQLNRWEQIKKFTILDHEMSVDDGEITPSLKVCQRIVLDKYRAEFDAMYPPQAARSSASAR